MRALIAARLRFRPLNLSGFSLASGQVLWQITLKGACALLLVNWKPCFFTLETP